MLLFLMAALGKVIEKYLYVLYNLWGIAQLKLLKAVTLEYFVTINWDNASDCKKELKHTIMRLKSILGKRAYVVRRVK